MHILMRTTAAGPSGVLHRGKVCELEPEIAQPMIDGGFAEHVQRNSEGKWEPVKKKTSPAKS